MAQRSRRRPSQPPRFAGGFDRDRAEPWQVQQSGAFIDGLRAGGPRVRRAGRVAVRVALAFFAVTLLGGIVATVF